MDDQFKFVINVFAYQLSRKYMTSWHGQIVLIDRYWDELCKNMVFLINDTCSQCPPLSYGPAQS